MFLPIVKSVWFGLTYLGLFSGLYLFRKAETRLNGVSWLPVTFLAMMCFEALVGGLLSIATLPANILTLSFANLAAGTTLWATIIWTKRRQSYSFEAFDFIAAGVLLAAAALLALRQFGAGLDINYETSDPSLHLQFAMDVLNTGRVSGMYLTSLNNALFIELLSPLTTTFYYYKFFIIVDAGMLALSALVFLASVRRYLNRPFMKAAGLVVGLVYLAGYPLNNMIFGFVYLGVSVSVAAMLIFLCDSLLHDDARPWLTAALLGLGCLGLMISYLMFVPVVFLGVFLALCQYQNRQRRLFSLRTLLIMVTVFLIPVILGMYYSYFDTFNSETSLTVGSVFNLDGYIYRDLYSSFIIFLPFALYGLVKLFKAKEPSAAALLFVLLLLFMAVLYVAGVFGKIAGYYYYKNYYMLWMLVFYLFVYGLCQMAENAKTFIVVYTLMWSVLAVLNFSGLEQRLYEKNMYVTPSVKAGTYMDVFNFNKWKLEEPTAYDPQRMEAYSYVYDNLLKETGDRVLFVGYWEYEFWYEAITDQRFAPAHWWKLDPSELLRDIREQKYGPYVLVQKNFPDAQFVLDAMQNAPVVFQNDFGVIYKISDG